MTLVNVEPDQCRHLASPGHNYLNRWNAVPHVSFTTTPARIYTRFCTIQKDAAFVIWVFGKNGQLLPAMAAVDDV